MKVERFLIVDDTDQGTLFFEMVLNGMGYNDVTLCRTGAEALNVVESRHIQFIICSWENQTMPGTLFVQKVRSNPKRRYLPCLIYSKLINMDDQLILKEVGLHNVLPMPLHKEQASQAVYAMIQAENSLSPVENTLRKMETYLREARPMEALKLANPRLTKPGPLRLRALTRLGEVWTMCDKCDRAEAPLRDALKEDPNFIPAIQALAKMYSRMGRHSDAIEILERMVDLSPKSITSMLRLGSAYVDADQHDRAKAIFAKVKKLDGDNQPVRDELGKLAFKEGDLPLAAQLLSQTECGDEVARHFNNMAITLVAVGDFPKAIETYRNAMQILADKAKMHLLLYNLGLALRKKGDHAEAFKSLARSYLAEPRFEKPYAALARTFREIKELGLDYDRALATQVRKIRDSQKPSGSVKKSA